MSHEIDQVSKTSISLRFIAVFHVKNDRLDAADFIFCFSTLFTLYYNICSGQYASACLDAMPLS